MDQELIETTIDKMKKVFVSSRFDMHITYTGKAFFTTGMAKIIEAKDLVGRELYIVYKAKLAVKRETFEDLIKNDEIFEL